MAASANDKFMKVGTATATTLSAPGYTSGGSSIVVGSTTNMPTDTGIIFAIDVAEIVDGEQVRVPGTYTEYQGTVSGGTSINNMTLTYGTPQNYAAGSLTRVYIPVSSEREERMVDGILAEHSQTGGHTTTTHSGVATFSTHIDVNDASTAIRDSSDNELVKFAKTASAVNEVTVQNAATANAPQIQATGGDSNIDLRLVPKGTGNIKRGAAGGSIDWWEELGRASLSSSSDSITVNVAARKYVKIVGIYASTGGTVDAGLRFNSDSGNNYAYRFSGNGGADSTGVSQNYLLLSGPTTVLKWDFYELLIYNISSDEKMGNFYRSSAGTAGAATAPGRIEGTYKWANTSAQITTVSLHNLAGTGDFAIGSELIVLGHD